MSDDTLLLGQLAEEFTGRVRNGELPNAEDYAQRHPELAERIRQLFPTLMFLEGLAGGGTTAARAGGASCHDIAQGTIFGSYRIEREIGRGGMGVVYEAVHVALDKHVAIKMLPILGPRDTGQLERFLREAKTAAGLHHTNIVPVFDVGQAGGVPYYAMQYIEGRGLDRVLRDLSGSADELAPLSTSDAVTLPHIPSSAPSVAEHAPEAPAEPLQPVRIGSPEFFAWVAHLGIQAAQGLDYAHQRGVIHRDIKPSNLLLDGQGTLWITDFGLARRLDDVSMTHTGAILGTPRYMSPEQAESHRRPIDHRTDIYSLGATLYELLTRRPLFDGQTPQEVLMQILGREPVALRRLNRAVPRDLETIVLKSMAKQPQDRYATAGELADDLERWLKMEPVHARRIGPIGRTIRWCRRNPSLAGLTLVTAAALLVGTIVSGYFAIQANRRADEAQQSAELARDEKQRADEHAVQAIQEREAAQDNLYRGLYEQARAIRSSDQPGRRWEVLSLLEQAEKLRTRDRHGAAPPDTNPSDLPSRANLRSEAVAALITPDVRLRREVRLGTTGFPFSISANGDSGAGVAIQLDAAEQLKGSTKGARIGIRLVDLTKDSEPLLHMWTKPEHTTFCPVLSPDGKTLATMGPKIVGKELAGIQIRLWSLPAFEQLPQVLDVPLGESAPAKIQELIACTRSAFSPDGKYLLATLHGQAILWELASGKSTTLDRAVSTPDMRNPWMSLRGAFSPDSARVAIQTGDRQVSLWKMDSLDSPVEIDVSLPINGQMSFSASEPLLAIYCLDPKEKNSEIVVWDYAKHEQRTRIVTTFPVGTTATCLAFDPQGRRLAASERSGASIYNLGQATPTLQWRSHSLGTTQLAWRPDGRQLISTGIDGTLKVWELSDDQAVTNLATSKPLDDFVLSPDGHYVAVTPAGGGNSELVDRTTGRPLRQLGTRGAIVFRRDGQQLTTIPSDAVKDILQLMQPGSTKAATSSASVVIEETLSGQKILKGSVQGAVLGAAFTPSGDLLVSIYNPQDGSSAIHNVSRDEAPWKSTTEGPRILPLLNTDATLAALIDINLLQTRPLSIWDLSANRSFAEWTPPGFSPYMMISPDNRRAAVVSINLQRLLFSANSPSSAGGDREQMLVTTWSLPDGQRQLTIPCNSPYRSISFSPDGQLFAMTSPEDGLQLWSNDRNELVFNLHPTGSATQCLAFAPDGQLAWCVESQPQIQFLDLAALRKQLAAIHLDW